METGEPERVLSSLSKRWRASSSRRSETMSENVESQQALYEHQLQQQGDSQNQAVPQAPQGDSLWEFADIGFDTGKKLWFVQLFDSFNQNVGFYTAKTVVVNGGCGIQYQWKDVQGRAFWHVRERFDASEVEGFEIDMKGNLVINFKKNHGENDGQVPKSFSYLQYAYHLTTKETAQSLDRSPLGFVEFLSQSGEVVGRINNRWIIVEDAVRKTTGELPKIRIRVERKDIGSIVVSRSSVIISSRDGAPPERVEIK